MKKILAMLLAGMLVMGLAACGGGNAPAAGQGTPADPGSTAGGSGNGYKIDVILKTTASEYWGYVVAGAEAYGADHPEHSVDVKGASSETAYEEQLNMIQADLGSGAYDGYVIAPLQAEMVKNLIAGQAAPIVAVDTDIDAPEVLAFVGTGNETAGALGGAAAVEAAKAAGWTDIKCIEIAGVPGDSTNEARMAGYKKGVEGAGGTFLDGEVQYANAAADQAAACMEAIMKDHPEGIAIICANNDDMAMAAGRAAKGNAAYANTIFLGFDGIQSACNAILEGSLSMSVCQQGYDMGYKSCEAVVAALNGETLDEFIDAGATVVDASTAQERLETLQGHLG